MLDRQTIFEIQKVAWESIDHASGLGYTREMLTTDPLILAGDLIVQYIGLRAVLAKQAETEDGMKLLLVQFIQSWRKRERQRDRQQNEEDQRQRQERKEWLRQEGPGWEKWKAEWLERLSKTCP